MNEEMAGLWLRPIEHILGQLWHRYSATVKSYGDDRKTLEVTTEGICLFFNGVKQDATNICLLFHLL